MLQQLVHFWLWSRELVPLREVAGFAGTLFWGHKQGLCQVFAAISTLGWWLGIIVGHTPCSFVKPLKYVCPRQIVNLQADCEPSGHFYISHKLVTKFTKPHPLHPEVNLELTQAPEAQPRWMDQEHRWNLGWSFKRAICVSRCQRTWSSENPWAPPGQLGISRHINPAQHTARGAQVRLIRQLRPTHNNSALLCCPLLGLSVPMCSCPARGPSAALTPHQHGCRALTGLQQPKG